MTKETFINSFGEKMTREKPGDPPNPTITLEEIKLLEEALSNQHDSNFESDYEMLQEEIVKSNCDWGFASSMCFKFEQVHEAFELLKKLKERTKKNGVEEKEKNKSGTNGK
mgnify:FL=1